MSQQAEHVYNDPARLARLEVLVGQLPPNGHVNVSLRNGTVYDGIVCARPSMEIFRDQEGREGFNALLRLGRAGMSEWSRYIWLDEISRIEHMDSIMGSES